MIEKSNYDVVHYLIEDFIFISTILSFIITLVTDIHFFILYFRASLTASITLIITMIVHVWTNREYYKELYQIG